jgi:hypothetical protein
LFVCNQRLPSSTSGRKPPKISHLPSNGIGMAVGFDLTLPFEMAFTSVMSTLSPLAGITVSWTSFNPTPGGF